MLQHKSYISRIPTGITDLTICYLHQIIIGLIDNHHLFLYNHIFNTVTYVVLVCICTNIKAKCTRVKRRDIQYIDHTHGMYVSS